MGQVLASSWALLLGMGLLMVGNGLQATLMGVRGSLEGFTTYQLSIITSGYFLGFLFGSKLTPALIRRVGHVRVFAALGSFISAALILFPTVTEPWAWTLLRVILGFAFCGVYVTAESWLNNSSTNETRGQTLSAYMIVQMAGIIAAQGILNLADPAGFVLFVIPSVLVSLSFAPILLSVSPTPAFERTKPMDLKALYKSSPLTFIGMLLMGGVFAAQFGMASVYASAAGLSVVQISTFVAAIFLGSLVMQYPIGWLSDRVDRRWLIFGAAAIGGCAGLLGAAFGSSYTVLLAVAFTVGGMSNPLYSLLIAYLNDYLQPDEMAAASGGLLFVNGLGAISGPVVTGWLMEVIGPAGFWVFISALMSAVAAYALFRMTRRAAPSADETAAYVSILPTSSPVALEYAQEWASEQAEAMDEASHAA